MVKKKNASKWNMDQWQEKFDNLEGPLSQKEQDIIEAAESLFSEKGHAKTSTAEIAKKANTTERTLFKYFPSKDHLIHSILLPIIVKVVMPSQVEKTLKILHREWDDPKLFIKTLYLNRLETGLQLGGKIKFLLGEVLQDKQLQQGIANYWQSKIFPEFVQVISNFQKKKKIRADIDPETISRVLIVALVGQVMLVSIFNPAGKDRAFSQVDDIVNILMDGICI